MNPRLLLPVIASLLISAAAPVWGQALGSELPGLLAYAREHNPELAAMRYEADAAERRVQPAGALPDPVGRIELQDVTNAATDAAPSLLPSRVGSTKYTLMQSLPFWGKRDLRRRAAEADVDVATARANASWTDVAAKIKTAYAQYVLATRMEVLTNEIIGIMTRLEAIAQARYAGGLVPQQDAIRAQLERTAMEGEIIALRSEKRQLRVRLNGLLARPSAAPLSDPRDFAPLPPPAALDPAMLEQRLRDRNPQLSTERARVLSAERGRDVTYRNRYPDVTVGISPIQMGSRVQEWEVMLEVSIPLQQSTRRSQESEANAMLAAARARQQATENDLLQQLGEQLAGLDAAREVEHLSTSALQPQAELTLRSASATYETGRVEFATLLDAQRQIRKARQDALKAAAEERIRVAEIERLIGEDL